jgi:signal transduction histidine kinase
MNKKRLIILILAAFFVCLYIVLFAFRSGANTENDVAAVNDISQSLAEEWDRIENTELPGLKYKIDYVVLDDENHFVKATRDNLNTDLSSAIRNKDTIVDIKSDNKVLGKLIIYNNADAIWQHYKNRLLILSIAAMAIAAALCIIYLIYIDRTIFRPFRKLQGFARHVAAGNLDMPLEMDRGNLFGAFTESFDLMREELNKARENERLANQSKKELVASLSHDIKTPVASIKAVTEVLQLKATDEYQKKQLEIINSKADQINTLITNMFSAALEELQELHVSATEQSSRILYDLIRNADYKQQTDISGIPECIVLADVLRLEQVIDNIISNSYKYAGTSIHVCSVINGKYLEISFKDFGLGVSDEELPFIFNKYFRAKNSSGKGGAGLGLFISKYFMDKMSGDIFCENADGGFIVTLKLLIA